MAILKIVFMIAVTMALTLTLTLKRLGNYGKNPISVSTSDELIASFSAMQDLKMVKLPKRVSRFLAEQPKNPRAADHCHKDNEICYILEGKNSTCCNNKCMDLSTDSKNCGACKNKCKYTETCCQGECVNLAYDKRHCGICGNKCMHAGYCLYGMCDYA